MPLKRGGADAAGIQASAFASRVGDRAHIPQRRGGLLPGRCAWLALKCNEFLYLASPDASRMSAGA
jgi:hypothetical protein